MWCEFNYITYYNFLEQNSFKMEWNLDPEQPQMIIPRNKYVQTKIYDHRPQHKIPESISYMIRVIPTPNKNDSE